MRTIAIAALAMAACAPQVEPTEGTTAPVPDISVPTDPLRQCDGSEANALLGRVVDAAVQAEAKRLVGAGTIRVIPPGAMVTMDYRGDRLNIDTDGANKAVRFHCG